MKRKLDMAVQDVVNVYEHSAEKWSESREKSLTCYEFCMNKQWSDTEIASFLKDSRPPIVYNLILPRLHNLIGSEQLNRRSTRIRPSSSANNGMADLLNGLFTNMWEVEEGEFELEKTFLDGLICLTPGWLGVDIEPNELGYLEYKIRSRNPMSIYPDPDYRDYKLRDCDWLISEKWLTLAEIKDTFKDRAEFKDENTSWWKDLTSRVGGLFGADDTDSTYYNKDGNKYKVLEMQTREIEELEVFADTSTGRYVTIPKLDAMKDKSGMPGLVFVASSQRKRIHIKTVIPYFNLEVVNEPYFINTDMYNLIPYCSFDYNNVKSNSNSLVNALIDPQKNLNKREIQKTTFIDHSINSPVLFSYEDKDTKDEFEKTGNKPGLGLLFRNYKVPPKRLQPANVGMDVWSDIADSVSKMNDISGINDVARGQSEYSNESARLFSMKAERVGATINPYYRNLSKTRKMIGEYFLGTVKQVYGEPNRVVDIMDRMHNVQEVVINSVFGDNDINDFEGRVILDEAEYSVNQQQENMQTKLALAQTIPPEYVNWQWILKDMELPDIQEQIDYIGMMQGQMADQQAMDTAMTQDQMVTQQLLAEKQLKEPSKDQNKNKDKTK